MASLFNHQFINVELNIDKKIPRTKESPLDYLKKRISNSLFLSPATPEEIETIIQPLNVKKAIDPYKILVFLLTILSRHIAQLLSSIIKLSFESEIFPDKLKVGKVVPLHKKDSCHNPSIIDQCQYFLCSRKFLRSQCTVNYTSF